MSVIDRKVKLDHKPYKDSNIFCNLILQGKIEPDPKGRKRYDTHLLGLTKGEAKELYNKLGEIL